MIFTVVNKDYSSISIQFLSENASCLELGIIKMIHLCCTEKDIVFHWRKSPFLRWTIPLNGLLGLRIPTEMDDRECTTSTSSRREKRPDSRDSGSTAGRLIGPEQRERRDRERELKKKEKWTDTMETGENGKGWVCVIVSVVWVWHDSQSSEQNKTATCKKPVVGLLGWREEGSTTAHTTKTALKTPEKTQQKVKMIKKTQAPASEENKRKQTSLRGEVVTPPQHWNSAPQNQPFFPVN